MFCKIDVCEIEYRKEFVYAEVNRCVMEVSTGTYRPEAKIICAELGLLIQSI